MRTPIDPIDELVARSATHPDLQRFHAYHRAHPEVMSFLVGEIRLRLQHFDAFSYYSLWEYARWKIQRTRRGATFLMNDHLIAFYARAITILFPQFNGHVEFRVSDTDAIFGTRVELRKRDGSYARRLEWADGISFESGWRPVTSFATVPAKRRRTIRRPR